MPRSSKWSLSLWSPQQNPAGTSSVTHTCHKPGPSHPSRFDNQKNILWEIQKIQPFFIYASLVPCYLVLLRPKYLPQHTVLEKPQPMFLPQVKITQCAI